MKKIKRCNNFNHDEVEVLVDLVENRLEVIESKKTDFVSNSAKEVEWRKIEGIFNSLCGTGRTSKMLRNKWDSLKKTVKREYAEQTRLQKTDGGPAVQLNLSAVSNRILGVIGVRATEAISDSDFGSVTGSTKWKRHYEQKSTAKKLVKQRSESTCEKLVKRKIEFIEFQMTLLKEEAERKEQRYAEIHALEIKILEAKLKNTNNV